MTREKKFYIIFILASLIIVFVALEVILRSASFSTGTGAGKASQRWFAKNWAPINQMGYRDVEFSDEGSRPVNIFLGDSFTAGHGVKFEETNYFLLRGAGRLEGNSFVNLARNGASTREELVIFNKFVDANPGLRINYVVQQYFGNDIDSYVDMKKLANLKQPISFQGIEILNYISTYFYIKEFGRIYIDELEAAYKSNEIYNLHEQELNNLHRRIRSQGGKVLFLVYPFLNSADLIYKSDMYVLRLNKYFLSTCKSGDVMVNVVPVALEMPQNKRVVNILDAHPSATLHSKVAEILGSVIFKTKLPGVPAGTVTYCEN